MDEQQVSPYFFTGAFALSMRSRTQEAPPRSRSFWRWLGSIRMVTPMVSSSGLIGFRPCERSLGGRFCCFMAA